MQYHKLTEHLDEKPFSCQECGAKFAANSTLKNHLQLHAGDGPFVCKHCLMTFMQASALAYHTKKKHAEGELPCRSWLWVQLTPSCPVPPFASCLLPQPLGYPWASGYSQIFSTCMGLLSSPHSAFPSSPYPGPQITHTLLLFLHIPCFSPE